MRLRLRVSVVAALLLTCVCAHGETVRSGYFRGMNLRPLPGADASSLGIEPAAVLVIAGDSGEFEELVQFDQWFRQAHDYEYPIYAVAVVPADYSLDILEEVIVQLELKVPVFVTRSDVLRGEKARLLVLDRGEAQQLPGIDLPGLERRMNELAEAAGIVPRGGRTTAREPQTTATPATGTSPYYFNKRYTFSVRFPRGWTWKESQNGDGAVGVPESDRTRLDIRVWATPNSEAAEGQPGQMTIPGYLNRHFSFLKEEHNTNVEIERRFVVTDNDQEGRDYTYSYTRPGGRRGQQYRGRIQAFEHRGVFKVANVEGPADEFGASARMIEDFVLSFRPLGE
jgi:hypothetical protein